MIDKIFRSFLEAIPKAEILVFDSMGRALFGFRSENLSSSSLFPILENFFKKMKERDIQSDEVRLVYPGGEIIIILIESKYVFIKIPGEKARTGLQLSRILKSKLSFYWEAESKGLPIMVAYPDVSIQYNQVKIDQDDLKMLEKAFNTSAKKIKVMNLLRKGWIFDIVKQKEASHKILISPDGMGVLDLSEGEPVIVFPVSEEKSIEKFFG